MLLGQIYLQERRFSLARDQFEEVLRKPGLKEDMRDNTRLLLAAVDIETGATDKAEVTVREILATNPDHSVANALLAFLFIDRGADLRRAEAHIRKAIESQPDNPAFQCILASALAEQGHEQEGLKILESLSTNALVARDPEYYERWGMFIGDSVA